MNPNIGPSQPPAQEEVRNCLETIRRVSENGRHYCYCEGIDEQAINQIVRVLSDQGYHAAPCWIRAKLTWENSRDPGEYLYDTITSRAVYVNWGGDYQAGSLQKIWNRLFYHTTVNRTLEWGRDGFDLYQAVNERN